MVLCCLASLLLLALTSCGFTLVPVVNPFTDLEPVPIDGVARAMAADIVPLGDLDAGQVIDVRVDGDTVLFVLILKEDESSSDAGVMVGGGPAGATFSYRISEVGRYFVFARFDPQAGAAARQATIAVSFGDPTFTPPDRQVVQVVFEDGYLSEPGLFDPESMSSEDQQLLRDISGVVAADIAASLQRIFEGTPIVVLGPGDALPADEPVSRLTYSPQRVLAEDQSEADAALPPPDPTRPECQVRVVFGEVLPAGTLQDIGNRIRDDAAVVYTGSFQGRGETCRTTATDSINNMVLALAQTGAHEIGHLVGLLHVEQVDIMNRTATLAFLRELMFQRGQVQVERVAGGEVVTEVLTTVIQDPELYLRANFAGGE